MDPVVQLVLDASMPAKASFGLGRVRRCRYLIGGIVGRFSVPMRSGGNPGFGLSRSEMAMFQRHYPHRGIIFGAIHQLEGQVFGFDGWARVST